jgi:ParB-like chromosome segregation protein Spo0J
MSKTKLVRVDLIDPSPFSDLSPPDADNQERIREDLEAHRGDILNPLHVVRKPDGRYELLAGHDRLEAA